MQFISIWNELNVIYFSNHSSLIDASYGKLHFIGLSKKMTNELTRNTADIYPIIKNIRRIEEAYS